MAFWKAGENCESKLSLLKIVNLTRGLRLHRYHCVALTGFWEKGKEKRIEIGAFILTRGLRLHRYHCVALTSFYEISTL
ncbi:MAG: hypothetical protein PHE75_06525 [Candidatus Cloacimonas acidaminovorans]|nr:hypothetical protein [Candidatus Cloacimonas acidaminovorans]